MQYKSITICVSEPVHERFVNRVRQLARESKSRLKISDVVRAALVAAGFDLSEPTDQQDPQAAPQAQSV